jgi:hypothetical protein
MSAGGTANQGYDLAFTICGILAVVGGIAAAWRTNAHRDAVALGLQEGAVSSR